MDLIRKTSDSGERYDLLEAFWKSQILSKYWMVEVLKTSVLNKEVPNIRNILYDDIAYVFGGWHGLTAITLADEFPSLSLIYSIDRDLRNQYYGPLLTNYDERISFVTKDMTEWTADSFHPHKTKLIINTSCEHLPQKDYDRWLNNLPGNTWIILQGNNFNSLPEHVRTSKNLDEFIEQCKLDNVFYYGALDCEQFTRFMVIGYKTL